MRNYKAVVTESVAPILGKVFASTKGNLKYSGMSKDEFQKSIENNQCYGFEIVEF